jgi:hypothetical protein
MPRATSQFPVLYLVLVATNASILATAVLPLSACSLLVERILMYHLLAMQARGEVRWLPSLTG